MITIELCRLVVCFNVSPRAVAEMHDCKLIEDHIVCDLTTQFTINCNLELSNVCHTHDVYAAGLYIL